MNSSPRESCCIQYATQTKQVLVCVVFSLRLVKRGDNRNRAFQQNMIQTSFLIHSRMEKIPKLNFLKCAKSHPKLPGSTHIATKLNDVIFPLFLRVCILHRDFCKKMHPCFLEKGFNCLQITYSYFKEYKKCRIKIYLLKKGRTSYQDVG